MAASRWAVIFVAVASISASPAYAAADTTDAYWAGGATAGIILIAVSSLMRRRKRR